MVYDLESFVLEVETFMKANLNTKITDINTEKSDSITLKTIDNAAYFFQTLDDEVVNYDPFLFFGFTDEFESDGIGPATIEKPTISVVITLADNGQDKLIGRRLLRYQRALKDLFHSDWYRFNKSGIKLKITNLVPISWDILNSSKRFRSIGIDLKGALA